MSRPGLHFTPDSGWINDPLGLTYRDGQYHLFLQYVPGSMVWTPECHWLHATSPDLLTWTEQAVVLAPGDGDGGVWSGCVVDPGDRPALLLYTSVDLADVRIGRIRAAHPVDDSWSAWRKGDVVAEAPADLAVAHFRDPVVLRDHTGHDDGNAPVWRMLVGAGLSDGTAAVLGYRSDDLETWTYDGVVASRHTLQRDPEWTGAMWECPQLFRVGDAWVLVVSVWEAEVAHHLVCAVGEFAGGRFTARSWQRLTYGPGYFAGSAFVDADGRPGLVHWVRGVAGQDPAPGEEPSPGWAGATSLPHLLDVVDGQVVARPHPALDARHGEAVRLGPGGPPAEIRGPVDIEWHVDDGGSSGLRVTAVDGVEVVRLDAADGELTVTTGEGSWAMPLGTGSVRVVLDGPVLEVFGDRGVCAVPAMSHGPVTSQGPVSVTHRGGGEAWLRSVVLAQRPGA